MSRHEKHFYDFGPFRLDGHERLLLCDGDVVSLTPKALDLLVALVEHNGQVLSKDELMKQVWPDSFVEEANLSHHIFVLRRALGEDANGSKYIQTIPRRGYRFVAKVTDTGDTSGDLLVAEHTHSHIVVEEEKEARAVGHTIEAEQSSVANGSGSNDFAGIRFKRKMTLRLAVVGALIALSIGVYFWMAGKPKPEASASAVRSLAVLPFKPLVAGNRDEALELGMADTLINKLSPIRELIVLPISSVRNYSSLEQDSIAAGRELGVDYVLEANLQMAGDKTRATFRLLNVKDGTALWTDKCDESCSTIFALQDAMAERIAGALAIKLTGEERKQLAKHFTENTEAYQLALKGRFYWSKWTPEGWKKSIEYYKQALEKDPNYALAYAWMAATYNVQANIATVRPKEAYAKAKELADKALELDDGLANGHYVTAALKMFYEWDWAGAERELRRAAELDSKDAQGSLLYAYYSMITGHPDESLAQVKKCEELSPVSPFISTNVGDMLYFARRYDEAIEQYRKTLDLDPNHSDARWGLAMTLVEKGMSDESTLEMNRCLELAKDKQETAPGLGYIYARSGKKAQARAIANNLEQLSKRSYYDPIKIAYIYAGLGEKDRAFEWLQKACDERSVGLKWINVAPRFDNLRKDPRFASLQHRIGLLP